MRALVKMDRRQVGDVAPSRPVGNSLENLLAASRRQHGTERSGKSEQFSPPELKSGLAHARLPSSWHNIISARDCDHADGRRYCINHQLEQKERKANTQFVAFRAHRLSAPTSTGNRLFPPPLSGASCLHERRPTSGFAADRYARPSAARGGNRGTS